MNNKEPGYVYILTNPILNPIEFDGIRNKSCIFAAINN